MTSKVAALMPAVAVLSLQCAKPHDSGPRPSAKESEIAAATVRDDGPTRMEVLPGATPPVYVMRGRREGTTPIVFLHGMCGHGLGYAQSFQFAAARKGTIIAPQGDKSCGGPWASWTQDLAALDARIVESFRTLGILGHEEPLSDVTVIGYSQGATRAEALARKWPDRYTRLVLIGAPDQPSPRGLDQVRAAVMMAGERDRLDLMKAGAAVFRAANIPATFQAIPEARHGEMGPHPEKTMGEALDWLWEHDRRTSASAAGERPSGG